MNRFLPLVSLIAVLGLAACDRPTVVTVPAATPVPVPGPAGPAGPAGNTGNTGATGDPGKTGGNTTVVVIPPAASAPTN